MATITSRAFVQTSVQLDESERFRIEERYGSRRTVEIETVGDGYQGLRGSGWVVKKDGSVGEARAKAVLLSVTDLPDGLAEQIAEAARNEVKRLADEIRTREA